jgi:hypothetical protein
VRDVRDGLALHQQIRPTVYVPMAQMPPRQLNTQPLTWVIRARTDPYAISSTVAKALKQASGGLPVAQIRTMDAVSAEATARTRFQMVLMAIFGGAALMLAALGVYGVMAYTVQHRTQEIGVRLALGAEAHNVRNMVIGQGVRVALPGIILGVAAAFGLARVLSALKESAGPSERGNAMPDTSQSLSTLLADIERLLLQDEPDGTLDSCYFGARFGLDTGHLALMQVGVAGLRIKSEVVESRRLVHERHPYSAAGCRGCRIRTRATVRSRYSTRLD